MPDRSLLVALSALAVGTLAGASPAGAGAHRVADVVLTVGTTTGGACNAQDESTCELVRIQVELGATPTVRSFATLVGKDEVGASGSVPVEPAVSPDGARLAWLERTGKSWQLWARALKDDRPHLMVKSGPPKEGGAGYKPEWPAWLDADTLLFDAKTADDGDVELKTIFSMEVGNLASPGTPQRRFGAGVDSSTGLQDVNVRATAGGVEAVTFGPTSGGKFSLDVRTLDGLGRVGATSPIVVPRGVNRAGKELEACHHPAWSPSGASIVCQAHRPSETVDGMETKVLYRYARDAAGGFASAGVAFTPVSPTAAGLDAAALLGPAAGCKTLTYKYAEYCRSDDWLVTTLYGSQGATGSGRGAVVGASRVLLVEAATSRYVDVTRLVEQQRGLKVGGLSSFTGTCRGME